MTLTEHLQPALDRKLPAALVAAVLLIGVPVRAADHLEPEASVFSGDDWSRDYEAMLAEAFKELYARGIAARVIAVPSFQHEYAIGIRIKEGQYAIVGLEPAVQLWSYPTLQMMQSGQEQIIKDGKAVRDDKGIAELLASIPGDWHDVKINRCEVPLEAATATRLVDVWRSMLRDTRYVFSDEYVIGKDGKKYQTVTIGSDGETYHFSMPDAFGSLAGKTWSPDEPTRTAKLVNIAFTLKDMCQKSKPDLTRKLSAQLDELELAQRTNAPEKDK